MSSSTVGTRDLVDKVAAMLGVGARRDDDQAGHALHAQHLQHLALALGVLPGRVDHRHIAGSQADVLDLAGDGREMRVGDVGHDEADELRVAASQAPRRAMRDIADRGDRLVDLADHLFADRRRAVEHGRHGGDRHPGPARHILDRRHAIPLANTAPGCLVFETFRADNLTRGRSLEKPLADLFSAATKRFDREETGV